MQRSRIPGRRTIRPAADWGGSWSGPCSELKNDVGKVMENRREVQDISSLAFFHKGLLVFADQLYSFTQWCSQSKLYLHPWKKD